MTSYPPVDPAAHRVGIERQLALLVPVHQHLRDAATAPSPLVAEDWQGPAAAQATRFLEELRKELHLAAEDALDEVRLLRYRLAALV